MSHALTAPAPAKINLTLRVLGTRPDGFHELESLVVRINLVDTVAVAPRPDGQLELDCNSPAVPCDASNLVLRAATALNAAAGTGHGAAIKLTKRIPPGAGLGGGSSDAATTLRLLDELWGLRLPRERLAEIGAALGSDVPLFLHGPQCVIRGRGERVEELPPPTPLWLALVLPEFQCATPAVYAAYDELEARPVRPSVEQVLRAWNSAAELMDVLFNDLEEAAFRVAPELGDLARGIAEFSGAPARLTGSGAALFRLFDDAPSAARYALSLGIEFGVRADVVAMRTVER